jgi:hypothetical protein
MRNECAPQIYKPARVFSNPFSTMPPPLDEDIPARKKPRLQCWIPVGSNFQACQIPDEASFPAIAADADTLYASPDAIAAVASADAGAHPAMATKPKARAARALPRALATKPNAKAARALPRVWTSEEDTKLTNAVKTTDKKKFGEEYKTDWVTISVLLPGRTKKQCKKRWYYAFQSKSDETTAHLGKWTVNEDSTLKDAVEKHNGKDWDAISELVTGRSKIQCMNRWQNVLHSKSDETTARAGRWTVEEDITLRDAVEKLKGEDWAAISELVTGRTSKQCRDRWHDVPQSRSDEMTARVGKWTTDEDSTLRDAVERHNGQN